MENFDRVFESCKNRNAPINERKFVITDIKTPAGKKIYTILNDAKIDIKNNIEKLFKKSDENRGVISNTVLEEMPNFIDLVSRLERMSTFKDSFETVEDQPEDDHYNDYEDDQDNDEEPDADYQDSIDDMENAIDDVDDAIDDMDDSEEEEKEEEEK